MDYPELEFSPDRLTAAAVCRTLAQRNCLIIRRLGPARLLHELLQRALRVFALRQHQLERRQLPAGYAKNYDYGRMTFIGIRELDMPYEPPLQVLTAFIRSPLKPVFEACLGQPLYFNLGESAVRRQLPDRPELYIPFHQDGPFCQRPEWPQLNCWVPLVACGRSAPGLEMLPLGLEAMLPVSPGQDSLYASYALAQEQVFSLADPAALWHPVFEPGDVLLLNPYALHRTYALPDMAGERYSLELRFVAGADIPAEIRRDFGLIPLP